MDRKEWMDDRRGKVGDKLAFLTGRRGRGKGQKEIQEETMAR